MYRSFLSEEKVGSVKRKVAVNLVGGNLVVALYAVLAAGVHHCLRADDVSIQEHSGILNGAVNMALRREINNDVRVFLLEHLENRAAVCDVDLTETEIRIIHYGRQSFHVACVRQAVKADYPVIRVSFQHIMHEISAYKSRAAGNDHLHCLSSASLIRYCP